MWWEWGRNPPHPRQGQDFIRRPISFPIQGRNFPPLRHHFSLGMGILGPNSIPIQNNDLVNIYMNKLIWLVVIDGLNLIVILIILIVGPILTLVT